MDPLASRTFSVARLNEPVFTTTRFALLTLFLFSDFPDEGIEGIT
jgi:hypothetical protein